MTEAQRRMQMNQQIIDEFRANDGVVGGPFAGIPLLLLHNRGAKSGEQRINPVAYLEQDGRLHVFATNGGRETNPGWYYNVMAHPNVTVEVGTRTARGVATVLTGADRDRTYSAQARKIPAFQDYEDKASRTIPVVAIDLVEP